MIKFINNFRSFIILLLLPFINSFNVDTKFPILLEPQKIKSTDSYFGASVSIHHKKFSRFLVGAPRSFSIKQPFVRTGVIFDCQLTNTSAQCDPIEEPRGQNNYVMKNMYLGGSITSRTGSTVSLACAHLRLNEDSKDSDYPNGACNFINLSDRQARYAGQIVPLKSQDLQIESKTYHYSHGMAGFSSLFIEGYDQLILGAPGFSVWRGAIVVYTAGSSYSFPRVRYPASPPDSYFGFSLTSGHFFRNRNHYIASGAPRDKDTGAVYYFLSESLLNSPSKALINGAQILRGHEIGEYFGYSILSTDLNGDSMDDLIVGAPFYSPDNGRRGDLGRVFVFYSSNASFMNPVFIYGDRRIRAKFGSSLASLGDLNADGFNDIIIGAPFEDNQGSVYIYLGSKNGISMKYSQKISASVDLLAYNLNGFGFSLSSGIDVDGNKYPDLIIGAPLSNQAVVLRSRPIGSLKVNLKFNSFSIDMDRKICLNQQNVLTPCFNVTYCMTLTGKYLEGQHRVEVNLELDTLLRSEASMVSRGYFAVNQAKLRLYTKESIIPVDREICEPPIQVLINKDIRDKLTPMELTLKYNLLEKPATFCSSCPQMISVSTIRDQIGFETGCGSDGECISDITLDLSLIDGSGQLKSIVEGFHNTINLLIQIVNSGENAHLAKVTLIIQPTLKILSSAYDTMEVNSSLIIMIGVGNPLSPGINKFYIPFSVRSSVLDHSKINVTCIFETRSKLRNGADKVQKSITIPIQRFASLQLNDGSPRTPIFYKHANARTKKYEKFHIDFTLAKTNFSSVRSPLISFNLPTSYKGIDFIYKPKIEVTAHEATTIFCDVNNLLSLDPFPVDDLSGGVAMSEALKSDEPVKLRKKRNVNQQKMAQNETIISPEPITDLNCSTVTCVKVECQLGNFRSDMRMVSIDIFMAIKLKNLDKAFGKEIRVFNYSIEASVKILDSLIAGSGVWSPVVTSSIILQQLPYKEEVALWIIIACSLAAIAFLLCIIILLCKIGFFKREKREKTKILQQRYSMAINPALLKELGLSFPGDDDEDDEDNQLESTMSLGKAIGT